LISIAYLFDNDNIVSKMKKLYRNTKAWIPLLRY
jgi:hypothetical protein